MATEKKKIDPAILEQARAEHGDVFELSEGGETVLVKRPNRGDYRRFRADRQDDKRRAVALEALFEACLVFPKLDDFEPILDRKPALADVLGGKLLEIASGETPEGK